LRYGIYLFDFDYTLADSEQAILACYRFVLKKHRYGGITDDAIRRTIGLTLVDSFRLLTGKEDEETLELCRREYVKRADEVMVQRTVLYETVLPMIRCLKEKDCKIAVISTKYRYRIMETLERYGIADKIDLVVGGEDVARRSRIRRAFLRHSISFRLKRATHCLWATAWWMPIRRKTPASILPPSRQA
jgi:phosphoglycolate phosphatase